MIVTLVQVLLNDGYSTGRGGRRHGRTSHEHDITVIVTVAATLRAVQRLCRVGNPHRHQIRKNPEDDCLRLLLPSLGVVTSGGEVGHVVLTIGDVQIHAIYSAYRDDVLGEAWRRDRVKTIYHVP